MQGQEIFGYIGGKGSKTTRISKKKKQTYSVLCITESQKLGGRKPVEKIRLFPKAHRGISLWNILIFPLTL